MVASSIVVAANLTKSSWIGHVVRTKRGSSWPTICGSQAHPSQTPVNNIHNALLPNAPNATGTTARIAPVRKTELGTGLVLFGTAILVGRMVRRRRRKD
jgi:hypothetical protein